MYHHVFLKDGRVKFDFVLCLFSLTDLCESIIAELAERSSIIIKNGSSNSNPSSRKNLKLRPYDRTTVQGTTFNMRGQLYRGHANATALFSSPVVSALGSESDDPGSSPGWGNALCPWNVREKNASSAFRLGIDLKH